MRPITRTAGLNFQTIHRLCFVPRNEADACKIDLRFDPESGEAELEQELNQTSVESTYDRIQEVAIALNIRAALRNHRWAFFHILSRGGRRSRDDWFFSETTRLRTNLLEVLRDTGDSTYHCMDLTGTLAGTEFA